LSHTDFEQLAACAARLQREFVAAVDPWKGSPFAWMRTLQASPRGKAGKGLVECLLKHRGYTVGRASSSEHDLTVDGARVELKTLTLWEGHVYKFQQVRDQGYDVLIGLGLSPFDAHLWAWSKEELKRHVIGKLTQHAGRAGSDTAWISVDPRAPDAWMLDSGGPLSAGLARLEALLRASG